MQLGQRHNVRQAFVKSTTLIALSVLDVAIKLSRKQSVDHISLRLYSQRNVDLKLAFVEFSVSLGVLGELYDLKNV